MVASEFQAVIMAAGKGSRMTELTAFKPKCLLPIGNKPMIWYPLQMLERVGFQDVIVVVQEHVRSEVNSAIERLDLKVHCDVVGISEDDWGTADSLHYIHDKIKTDVIVVSCDLITDVELHKVLDRFRVHQAAVTALLLQPSPSAGPTVTPGPKSKQKPERDIIGIDSKTSRLVFMASASDFEESLTLPKSLLKKHQRLSIHSRLADSHLYVLRKWVCDYLAQERSFTTLKGELLPHIVKKQLSKPPPFYKDQAADNIASVVSVKTKKDVFQFIKEDIMNRKALQMSAWNDHCGDMKEAYHGDAVRCYTYIPDRAFGMRANTLSSYYELNRQILNYWSSVTAEKELIHIDPKSNVKSKQVDSECIVGEGTEIVEKTSIKSCIIGSQCSIKSKVRLTNCVLMNGVKIGEGSTLQGCIVCDDATIENNCDLRDCLVGSRHVVHQNGKYGNEFLTDVDRLMEI